MIFPQHQNQNTGDIITPCRGLVHPRFCHTLSENPKTGFLIILLKLYTSVVLLCGSFLLLFSDTLADLKEFSPSEKDYIKRLLDRNGPRTANDELLNVVQRRPRAFAQLVASVKTKRNDDLLMKIWDFVK